MLTTDTKCPLIASLLWELIVGGLLGLIAKGGFSELTSRCLCVGENSQNGPRIVHLGPMNSLCHRLKWD